MALASSPASLDVQSQSPGFFALREILAVLDEAPEGLWVRRVRTIARTALRQPHVTGAHLNPKEEADRRAVYDLQLTDREAGRRVGISGQAFQVWRKTRGLAPWRMVGRRRGREG